LQLNLAIKCNAKGLYAFSGRTGRLIWKLNPTQGDPIMLTSNFYTPLLLPIDVDEDGLNDLIMMHGGDPLRKPTDRVRVPARMLVLSARTGRLLRWALVPDSAESYYSPQLVYRQDAHHQRRPYLLYGTGGETHGGSLFIVPLDELLLRDSLASSVSLYTDCCKGVMAPAVLVDLNDDQTVDIVLPTFNSTVIAFDGQTLRQLWRTRFAESESYSTPAVAFYNDDLVPDFLVQYQHGPGFPIYYYSQVQVLDGRDGRPLLNSSIKMLIGSQSSPLTVSIRESTPIDNQIGRPARSFGHDQFLFWQSSCEHSGVNFDAHELNDESIGFKLRFANVHEASRADYCKLRFNQQMRSRLQALGNADLPVTLYDSSDAKVKTLETAMQPNYTQIGQKFLRNHQEYSEPTEDRPILNQAAKLAFNPADLPLPPTLDLNALQTPANDNNNLFAKYKSRLPYNALSRQLPPLQNIPQLQFLQQVPPPPSPLQSGSVQLPLFQQDPAAVHFERDLDRDFFASSHGHFGPEVESEDMFERSQRRPDALLQRLDELSQNQVKTDTDPNDLSDAGEASLNNRRRRRHVGVHDGEGVQRIISTGSLAPSDQPESVDVIFTTYWIPPSTKVKLVTKKMQACLDFYMRPEIEQIRFNPASNLAGYDHDAYGDYANTLCEQILRTKSGQTLSTVQPRYTFNPFNVQMGSLTIYRKRLRCRNKRLQIEPYQRQLWPSYMGLHANSLANL
jgi:hypothetical protein